MEIEKEIWINQYGQGILDINQLLSFFKSLDNKRAFFIDIRYLIMQSKPKEEDIEPAIAASKLKPTYTPCVLLRKGVGDYNLQRITELPEYEQEKAFVLLLNLFRICYYRRFQQEKNIPHKWWYWDLSDQRKVERILSTYGDASQRIL